MTFPESLTFRVIDGESGMPVPGILIFLEIQPRNKNGYDFRLPLTGAHGETEIQKAFVLEKINHCLKTQPMDYSLRLEDCTGVVNVEILDEHDLRDRIALVERNHPEYASEFSDLVSRATNKAFPSQTFQFEVDFSVAELKVILMRNCLFGSN
jgi:hypothetical protein